MCRHACPVAGASGLETHTPQSKMDVLNQLRKGELEWTPENADPLWACTACRQCTNFCHHDNEPGMVLLAGRAEANARGAGHPTLKSYADRFQKRQERLAGKLRDHFPDDKRRSEGDVGFWPGCDAIGKGMDDIDAALQLFANMGGENVRVVDSDQVCGGYPLLAAGYPDMFRWHAKRVADSLSAYRTIVTNCSACIFTMQRQYEAENVNLKPEILSISEYLASRIASVPRSTDKVPIYYHDPCYLARYSGIIEEPRMVLSRIAEVRDFDWSHSDTECCGGAGLLPKTDPDTADSMARRRLREVSNRGGGTVVTSCATCTYMLRSNAPSNVKVVDLASFVADAFS